MKEERRMILQMIEDGKITAEEGVALLEALERTQTESRKEQHETHQAHKFYHTETEEDMEFDEKENLSSAFEDIGHAARKIGKEAKVQSVIVTNKIGDLVERIITKVKDLDFDFDFTFSNWPKVEKIFTGKLPQSGIIDLTTVNGKVEIIGWDQDDYQIKVTGAIRAEDQIEANAILQELIHMEETEDGLNFGIEQRRGTKLSLEVYLPKVIHNDLKVRTSNGAVEVDRIELQGAKLESSNGAIQISGVKSTGLFCETSNGRIHVEDSNIDELYAKTSNGPVRLEGVLSKVKCYTSNGSIRYEMHEVREGQLDFETTNGSIEIKVPKKGLCIDGDLSTSFGSLDCTIPNIEVISASKEIAHRHLRFKSTGDEGEPFAIICKTSNGGIRVHPTKE